MKKKLNRYVRFIFPFIRLDSTNAFYILISLLVLILALFGFIELAEEVMEGDTQYIDEAILHAFRQNGDLSTAIGPPWLLEAMLDITALGGYTVLILVTIIAAGFCIIIKMFGVALLILAASLGGMGVCLLMKQMFGRTRPGTILHLTEVYTASFPSGHSMLSAAIYLSISVIIAETTSSHRIRIYVIGTALLITGLVGISRVFLGVHYPSDVLAGWAAGISWAILCWLVAAYLKWRA